MISYLQTNPGIVPLYHPTTVLLVDDNEDFLRSLKLVLGPGFQCFSFQTAQQAIDYVRDETQQSKDLLSDVDLAAADTFEHIRDPDERRLHFKFSRLPQVFADEGRFGKSSVIVADHAMPGMTGVAMLEAMRDLPLRKLLLSGAADDQIVVQAFNSGLIDAFYPKHHPALHDALADHLLKLQFEYFRDLTSPFDLALASPDARFLSAAGFADTFRRFVSDYQIIEYCVLMDPPGVFGLDDAGNPAILLVVDADFQQASFEIAQAELAPTGLLRCLLDGSVIAVFPTANGFYTREMEPHWRQFIWPGRAIADSGWRCTVIDEPEVIRRVCRSVTSYAAYRQRRLS